MTKCKPSLEEIKELTALVSSGTTDLNSREVRDSGFSKHMESAEFLEIRSYGYFGVPPDTLLLMARIAAVAPILHTVDISDNALGPHGIPIAAAFATSRTIHTIKIGMNGLGRDMPAVAAILAASPTMRVVDMIDDDVVGDIQTQAADVFTKRANEHSDAVAANDYMKENLTILPKPLIDLISSYTSAPPISYRTGLNTYHEYPVVDSWGALPALPPQEDIQEVMQTTPASTITSLCEAAISCTWPLTAAATALVLMLGNLLNNTLDETQL